MRNYIVKFYSLIIAFAIALSCFSCLKSDDDDIKIRTAKDEEQELLSFIEKNEIDESAKTSTGLYFVSVEEGEGEFPQSGDTVRVKYVGCFLNGRVFDQNLTEGISFVLGQKSVIQGWEEGIAMIKPGGAATLVVPSSLAYGPFGYYTIPPFTPLLFDVELVEVTRAS